MTEKKTLILHESDTDKVVGYLKNKLEERGHAAELREVQNVDELNEVTRHIEEHGSEYDSIVMRHLGAFEYARSQQCSGIPDMLAWAKQVQQSIPNIVLWENTNAWINLQRDSDLDQVKRDGVPVFDWMDSIQKVAAAVLDLVREQPCGRRHGG